MSYFLRQMKNMLVKFRRRDLFRDTVTTSGWVLLGKGVGFLVPFFVAAWFGVTGGTDAFFFAYGLVLFLSCLFAPVMESVIVPYIIEAKAKGEDTGKLTGRILSLSSIGLIALTCAVLLSARPLLSVLTRFDSQSLDLINLLLLQISPLVLLQGWTSILSGALNAYKRFAFPAVSPAFRAIVNLGFIFIFKESLGVHAIALGYVAGEIVRLAVLLWSIRHMKLFKLSFSPGLSPEIKEFFKIASYQVIGMSLVGLNPFIDRAMASWLVEGSVSVLYYADRLYMIPAAFFSSGLIVTVLSHWSCRYQESGPAKLNHDAKKAANIVFLTVLPASLILIIFHQPIVNFIFGRGEFPPERLIETGRVWVFYLAGITFYILKQIFARGYIVLKRTKILMIYAFFMVILNIVLNYILMKPLQTAGIALSTTIVSALSAVYMGFDYFRRTGRMTSGLP